MVGDGALAWAAGEGVICNYSLYGAFAHVLDVFPAGDAFFGVAFAGVADAGESFADGEDDAACLVVEGFFFVLAHDGELHAVDGDEFVEGEAEGHGGEDVDFDEGLAAGVVGAEGAGALPVGGEGGEEGVGEAGVGFGEGVGGEGGEEGLLPEVGVVGGEAV